MPGPITALARADARSVTLDVLGAVVDAIVTEAAERVEVTAPPPTTRTPATAAEAFLTRLAGSAFSAPVPAAAEVSKRLDRWANPLAGTLRTPPDRHPHPPTVGSGAHT